MPNHIQNKLQFIGDNTEVQKVLNHIQGKSDDGTIVRMDFNKIKPMPESLNVQIHSAIETAVKVALKMDKSDNPLLAGLESLNRDRFKSPLEFTEQDWNDYIQCLNNVRNHGFIYWYDWNIENWGTKWNAYAQGDKRNTDDTLYFQTAWSSPISLFLELSRQFPLVEMQLTYADEDSGSNTGKLSFEGGNILTEFTPESQSKEGYQIYFELNPESEKEYKLVNDKYEYIEEEA